MPFELARSSPYKSIGILICVLYLLRKPCSVSTGSGNSDSTGLVVSTIAFTNDELAPFSNKRRTK